MGVLDSLKVIISGDSSGATAAANETAVALERTTIAQANLERESARLAARQAQAAVVAARQTGNTEALTAATNQAAAAQLRLAEATAAAGVASAEAATARAARALADLGTTSTATAGAVGSLLETLKKFGPTLIGVGTAAAGLAAVFNKAKDAASALAEQQSATNVVFGDSSTVVREFAEGATTAFGLSERAALQAANSYAALFKNAGLAEPDVARFSVSLTKLAADISSFRDIAQEDVAGALRSALTGEVEPARRLGVILNDNIVTAKALEMGLGDLNGNVDDGAKVVARYSILLEQTSDAQGDFERTGDGAANAQRTLTNTLEDLNATLGTALLPTFATFAKDLATIATNVDKLVGKVGFLGKALKGVQAIANPITASVHLMAEQLREVGFVSEDAADATQGYAADVEAADKVVRKATDGEEARAAALEKSQNALESMMSASASYESAIDAVATAEENLAEARGGFAEKTREQAEATADMRNATLDAAAAQVELNRAQRDAPLEIADAQNEAAAAATNIAEKTRAVTVATERYGAGSLEARDAQDQLAASITDSAQAAQKAKDLAASGGRTPDVLTAERAVATAKERQAKAAEDKVKADNLDPAKEIAEAEEKVADAKDRQVIAELNLLQSLGKYNTTFGTTLDLADKLNGKLDATIIKQARILIEQQKINDAIAAAAPAAVAAAARAWDAILHPGVPLGPGPTPAPAPVTPFAPTVGTGGVGQPLSTTNITVNANTNANPKEIAREIAFVGRSRAQ